MKRKNKSLFVLCGVGHM